MKKENLDFPEALQRLAEKAGVQLKPPTPQEQVAAEEHDHLRKLLEEALTFYHHQLLNTPPGRLALDYLRSQRGLNDATIEAFGLGYAPNAWEAALQNFTAKGYSEEDLFHAGLLSERQVEQGAHDTFSPGFYDRFRHRIMIPIRDERGRMAGFGARILNPDDVPKFLNSPQTPVFDKGHLLYGMDRARKAIRLLDQAVIVEGYLDVIALHQAGFTNAVSPMGTALTSNQLFLLKRFSRRIVLALDPDAAGSQATLRGLQVARQAMDREQVPVFDASNLLKMEARLQADIRVTTLPEGMDPDEVVQRDPQEWERLVAEARPVVVHVMETLAAGLDLDDPKVKTNLAAQVLPLIQDVSDPIERDAHRQRLARLLRVDERALLEAAPSTRRARPSSRSTASKKQADLPHEAPVFAIASSSALEAHCLGVLLRRPDLLYKIDRAMQESGLRRITGEDFRDAGHQAIFQLLQESVDQDITEPLNYVMNNLSLEMMDIADNLLARSAKFDMNDERVLEDTLRGLIDLRQRSLRQDMDYLRYLMQEAQEEGDLKTLQYSQAMFENTRVKQRLDQALNKFSRRPTTVHPEG